MDYVLAALPLLPPGYLLGQLLLIQDDNASTNNKSSILSYIALSIAAFLMTNSLVPHIKVCLTHLPWWL